MNGQDASTPGDGILRRRESLLTGGAVGSVRRTTPGAKRPIHHSHPDAEFNLVMRGGGVWTVEGQAYELRPGHLIWLMPHHVHKLVRAPGLEMWVVLFDEDALKPEWRADLSTRPSRMLDGHDLIELDHLLTQVALDSDEPETYNAGVVYVLMRALRASRDRPSVHAKPMHPAVARALLLMREQAGAHSLSDLATEAGVAAPYLSRLLVEHTGRSFIDWRNRIRLDRFIDSYHPGANLLAAALDAGFGSYTRFHHIFSELIGCPPSEWMSKVDAGEVGPRASSAAPVAGYGIPAVGLLSARQRWTPLTRMICPAIGAVLGPNFGDRMLAAIPGERPAGWGAFDDLEPTLSPADIEQLLASFAAQDPEAVADYRHILQTHDLASVYRSVCCEYRISACGLSDMIASLLLMLWASTKPIDVNGGHHAAIKRSVESALAKHVSRMGRSAAREAYVAMLCQHVLLYRASVAARSSGDARLFDELGSAVGEWSHAVLGRDIQTFELTSDGLAAPVKSRPNRRGDSSSILSAQM
jgi:AraC-like DNA-binding protein/quercetin dioxygenase-like cupin family protein